MKFTDYLAIYAAVLSTSVFIWNILHSRPRIRVDIIPGFQHDTDAQFGYFICVRNISSHQVHLASIDLLYRYAKPTVRERIDHVRAFRRLPIRLGWVHNGLSSIAVDTGCPMALAARTSHDVFVPENVIEKVLAPAVDRELIACVQDKLWNNVYSKPFVVPTESPDDA